MPNSTLSTRARSGPAAARRQPWTRSATPFALAALALGGLAALSLLAPFAPVFDPWGWLVWARELGQLELDTSAGPSWKPLPVLISVPFAWVSDLAPELWLLIARWGWLAVAPLAATLAWRLEGSGGRGAAAAAGLAGVGTLFLHDGFTPWARQFAGGLSEPLLTALVLAAVLTALARRPALAAGLGWLACLIRPEAWPFAAAYAWREARAGHLEALPVVLGAVLVGALWFGPDLLGAGDALEGARRAREGTGSPPVEALEVLGRAAALVPVALWVGALAVGALAFAAARAGAGGEREREIAVLAGGTLAWIALVAVLAAAGYAGLPRFMAPAGALACALGGVGLVRLAGALLERRRRAALGVAAPALAALVLVAGLVDAGMRAGRVPGQLAEARDFAEGVDELFALAARDREALLSCPPLATSDLVVQTALAWRLEVPLSGVAYSGPVVPRRGTLVLGPRAAPGVATLARLRGQPVGAEGRWEAYRAGACAGSGSATPSTAGVTGARR
ncbi:MAG TPA: hypothetical protein VIL04_11290 [Solirubrobacterales bacterium]|jgi:hypothetical protein